MSMQLRMLAPGAVRLVVLYPRLLQRLVARLVAEIIGKFRALGAGDKVQHGVIIAHDLLLGAAEGGEHLAELLVGDIGLVVEQRAVIDDEHVFLGHHLRGLEGKTVLVQLILDDKILEIVHGDAVAERLDTEAGDEVGRGLGNGDDLPAVVLLELLEDAADERGLAGSGAAGQNDPGNFLSQLGPPLCKF